MVPLRALDYLHRLILRTLPALLVPRLRGAWPFSPSRDTQSHLRLRPQTITHPLQVGIEFVYSGISEYNNEPLEDYTATAIRHNTLHLSSLSRTGWSIYR